MPPVRSAPRSSRRAVSRPRRYSTTRPPASGAGGRPAIRWDRVGRTVLLIVLVVVGALYVQHAISFLSTRARAEAAQASVRQLVRSNHQLEREQRALQQPATILALARELGMVRPDERPYVISGLPSR
jgi:cell division protein FtsB